MAGNEERNWYIDPPPQPDIPIEQLIARHESGNDDLTYRQRRDAAQEILKEQIQDFKARHPIAEEEKTPWERLQAKSLRRQQTTNGNRVLRREIIGNNKDEMPQTRNLRDDIKKRGTHSAMQVKNPRVPGMITAKMEIFDQQSADYRRMYPKDERWGPDNDLTWEQFRLWGNNVLRWYPNLTPEEKFNTLQEDALIRKTGEPRK